MIVYIISMVLLCLILLPLLLFALSMVIASVRQLVEAYIYLVKEFWSDIINTLRGD